MKNLLLSFALALAAKGKPVFPCNFDKKPITPNGFKAATTDTQVITKWWTGHPQANIAMPTGVTSGVVVLDVDMDEGKKVDGEKSLAELVSQHDPLPPTLTVKTPRGGRHIYYQHPGGKVPCSTSKLGAGLDVRADGGYVLLPPSKTARGCYEYANRGAVAPAPDWLLKKMTRQAEPARPSSRISDSSSSPAEDEERIRAALVCIPASVTHDEWVRIGMALHAWDVARGKTIWREWSLTCPEKFNEHEFETSWHSFKPGGGVKLGTLFELAKGYGWRPKTSSRENPQPRQNETELSMPDWPAPPRPEVYHGVLGEYVRKLEPHTEADPMAILIQLLVAVGNVVGRSAHFEVEADQHYLNMNAVITGNSSKARKGTSWGHVKKVCMQIDPSWPRPLSGRFKSRSAALR